MSEPTAISFANVAKVYRLYDSLTEQALDVLGLSRLRFWRKPRYREHQALSGINLELRRGERVGILGRNGAGKTTLLKLITGNFTPTSGNIEVRGKVQALMSVGLGFHPEFSGYENILSALAYNGLPRDELDRVVKDVVDFVELGEFLHQPMKTYSLGMQARVMFASATAIQPDTLIVDEVLGAGDAYFSAKSALRMQQLAASGCTLLLVSHSMQQIIQFCERAVWLERGSIVMDGDALSVVKAYEEFIDHLRAAADRERLSAHQLIDSEWFRANVLEGALTSAGPAGDSDTGHMQAVSRWAGEGGLRISSVRLRSKGQEVRSITPGEEVQFEIDVTAERTGTFECRYVVLLFTEDGRPLTRHLSNGESVRMEMGQTLTKILTYNSMLLGNGEYVFSVAVYKTYDPRDPQSAVRYDLLSRSFAFRVRSSLPDPSVFHHPAHWSGEVQP